MGHLLVSTVTFLTLIAACFVFARRFAALRQPGWAIHSVVSDVLSFVTLAVLSTGHLWTNIAFVFGMLNLLLWVSTMAAKLLIEPSSASVGSSQAGPLRRRRARATLHGA